MLSIETEVKLAKILLCLAEGEKSTDINRQILVELDGFDPYQIFTYLDLDQKNRINSSDLLNYLQEKGVEVNDVEIKLLILFYDRDFDGVLSYPEFNNFIQSDFSPRKKIYGNNNNNVEKNTGLPNNVDQALCQLLVNEIDLMKKILPLLNELKMRYDFNIHDLYHAVKSWNCIDENSLKNFFGRNQISYLESDIRKIMKRLDLNMDGKIDLGEFHVFFGFPDCKMCCPQEGCKFCGVYSCNLCLGDSSCFMHNCIHGNMPKDNIKNNININNNPDNKEEQQNSNNNCENEKDNNNNQNQKQMNKINPVPVPQGVEQRNKTPAMNYNYENRNISNNNKENNSHIANNQALNKEYKNNLNFNNFKKMEERGGENYNFNFNYDKKLYNTNSFFGPISDNLTIRSSPTRKYSPKVLHCKPYYTNPCPMNCGLIYHPEPCERCIHNHCNFCNNKELSTFSETYNKSQYSCCQSCHSFPCCCCMVCHVYPCKCCPVCHSAQCKCCQKCKSFPCICCPVCNSPECVCCKNCKKYPCICCEICHFPNCRCCRECGNYPCICCNVCHMAKCMCCEKCKTYPCRCCPDCHFVDCKCCHTCGCFPCTCGGDARCNCHMRCVNCICPNCHNNPCICCPYCHINPCQCPECTCDKHCLAMSLNNLNALNCPVHNVHTMKHNEGCPFGPKCSHTQKCAHPKKNDQNDQNNSLNNSPNHNHMANSFYNQNQNQNNNNYPGPQDYPQYKNNMPNNKGNNIYNNQNDENNYNNNQNSIVPNDYEPNPNYDNNNNPNNNEYYEQMNDNNNIPNESSQNQNFDNNRFYPNNQNQNQYEDNKNCPLSPVSSPFPPNSPFFNINEPGQKSNWIFCPKCNVYHRCPHPGCEHNPNKRTTTHKCLHDDNENQGNNNSPQYNNNYINSQKNNFSFNPNNNNINPNQNQMNQSQTKKSKKRGVFASCPYQEELGQFVDFLGTLMVIESRIEELKIELARREDFNFEDIFRIFEVDGKNYIEPEDLKQGLQLLGLNPSDFDIKLLMKRFDLNQQGLLTYVDFFDMVVSFEKKLRNTVQIRPPNSCCPCKSPDVFDCDTLIAIKNLFKYIIECENEINQMRANFDSLRSKFSDVVQFLDYSRRGVINRSDLKLYLTQFNKFTTSKECDLLFIRLDKTRSGEVGINEIENELMFIR